MCGLGDGKLIASSIKLIAAELTQVRQNGEIKSNKIAADVPILIDY